MPTKKKTTSKEPSIFDYFRFGESYTSLILGILVVVIVTGLLLGFVRNRNAGIRDISSTQTSQNLTKISQTDTETVMESVTEAPAPTAIPSPAPTAKPTAIPTSKPKATATPVPTKKVAVKTKSGATRVPAKKALAPSEKPAAKPAKPAEKSYLQGRTYVAKAGDTLWSIAETTYGSGYNWVDIARANKLSNPNDLKLNQKIVLPKAEQKNATSEPEWKGLNQGKTSNVAQADRIVGKTYVVRKNDTLWNISVRTYGDGYKWSEIARVNKLPNPDLIFVGVKLNLPRK